LKRRLTGIVWVLFPWCAALGIHGVLLFTPLSNTPNNPSKSATTGRVRVVDSSSATQKPASKELPAIAKSSASTITVAKRRPPTPAKPPIKPKPPVKKAAPVDKTATITKSSPVTKAVKQSTKTRKPQPPIAPNDLVVNLAQLPDTQPCQQVDGCWKTQKSQWRSVYTKVHDQITAQGYRVIELDLEDDTGFRVSQIAKNGQTKYYLHLLSTLEGTIYILNPSQLSKEEVEQRVSQVQQTG